MAKFSPLDPIVHAPIRLAVLTLLVTVKEADFTFLKQSIEVSDGNLSTHLTRLETAGYIEIEKKFVKKKPRTICSISQKGLAAYEKYVEGMEQYLRANRRDKKSK